jgi:hypothetical protein
MKSIHVSSLLLALPLAALLTGDARAQDTDDSAPFANNKAAPAPFAVAPSSGFGAIGQWVLTMRTTQDNAFVFFHKGSGDGNWELALHPAIDYFITGRFSVGGTVGIAYSPRDAGSTWLDIGARGGFNLNITDHIGWWPNVGISARHENVNHNSATSTSLNIFAPFLYHLVPHLFAGVGPSFAFQISGGDGSGYGLDFVLGGWL